jgi:biopolymer transport protein ExbD
MRRFGRSRRARHAQPTGLRLTSMMDILTTLLLFVLKSFVAGGEATVPPPGLTLPRSTAEDPMQTSLVIAIEHDAILVGNEEIASLEEVKASPQMTIAPLEARLKTVWEQLDAIAAASGAAQADARVVTIQGDRDIEYRVLQKVMYTLNRNGFEDIALAVLKRS